MKATAHFETDFLQQIADAKRASQAALLGASGFSLIVTEPRNIAFIDAVVYVERNFAGRDRRRLKREMRKALKRAYAGELPKIPVTLTSEPFDLGGKNGSAVVGLNGPIGEFRGFKPMEFRPAGWE